MREKLSSRKFLTLIALFITGIACSLGATDSMIAAIYAICLIMIPGVAYMIVEGKIDKAALEQIDMDALIDGLRELFIAAGAATTESTATLLTAEPIAAATPAPININVNPGGKLETIGTTYPTQNLTVGD